MSRESDARCSSVYGVVGGMGPLASAEFLKTIYEFSLRGREQDSPTVILYSNPSFPDRTDAFLKGADEVLLAQLNRALRQLSEMNAVRIVLCCMTIHYLLPRLTSDARRKIWSLLDVIADRLAADDREYLLICSSGTRRLRLFEDHPQWRLFKDRLVLPSAEDQELIHRKLIYPIKLNPDVSTLFPLLELMLEKYRVNYFVAGCSEIHLLAKRYAHVSGSDICLDPLTIIAREIAAGHV
ncbi:MAG TPA: aspartate/glutamate racemase family protein [Pyrinomonadaceae bacterium]|nr:aspartate/glutamate racemase family protein [Pyrinomonadaceae bacterium]